MFRILFWHTQNISSTNHAHFSTDSCLLLIEYSCFCCFSVGAPSAATAINDARYISMQNAIANKNNNSNNNKKRCYQRKQHKIKASKICSSGLWGKNRCEIITNVRKFICIFCTQLRQRQKPCATKDYRRIFVLFVLASLSVFQAVCEITKFATDNLRAKTTK